MFRVKRILRGSPIAITFSYVFLGALWVLYSDKLLLYWFDGAEVITQVQSFKGWFFVLATGTVLYLLLRKNNSVLELAFENLRESNERFIDTFESAPLGIAYHRPNENWIQVNDTLSKMLGYGKEEFRDLNFEDFIHFDDLEEGRKMDNELVEGKRNFFKMEKRYKNKSGDYFYGLVHKSMIMKNGEDPYIVVMLEDISEQKEVRKKLIHSIKEKEVLLAEVHHRVRNNLALISALFQLQSMTTTDDRIQEVLQDSLMRIKCLSLVHETYANANEIAHINFGKYIEELVQFVDKTLNKNRNITLKADIDAMQLNINQAIPAGLLCNELLTLSYSKLSEQQNKQAIEFKLKEKGNRVHLLITDIGEKSPLEQDESEAENLRALIIETLISQLQGAIDHSSNDRENMFSLAFEKRDYKGPSSTFASNDGFQITNN